MNKMILAAAATLLAANLAFAQAAAPATADKKPATTAETKKAPSEKQVKQQERMKSCNKDAGDKKLKGDTRKKFMSECLKADKAADKPAEAAKPAMTAHAAPAVAAPAAPAKPAEKK